LPKLRNAPTANPDLRVKAGETVTALPALTKNAPQNRKVGATRRTLLEQEANSLVKTSRSTVFLPSKIVEFWGGVKWSQLLFVLLELASIPNLLACVEELCLITTETSLLPACSFGDSNNGQSRVRGSCQGSWCSAPS